MAKRPADAGAADAGAATPRHHEPLVPATPDETADLLAILRATIATILTTRKDFRLRITERQREKAFGVLVRVAMTTDGAIEAWLEPPVDGMRHGVPYLGENDPRRAAQPLTAPQRGASTTVNSNND